MPKIYVNDLGIIKTVLGQPLAYEYSLLPGAAVENFVFTELLKKCASDQIYFYRTLAKAEIDFVFKNDGTLRPIEVKFRHAAGGIPAIIKNFREQYKKNTRPALINTQAELRFEKDAIFLPASLFGLIKID